MKCRVFCIADVKNNVVAAYSDNKYGDNFDGMWISSDETIIRSRIFLSNMAYWSPSIEKLIEVARIRNSDSEAD